MSKFSERKLDRYCILKACARGLLEDYGEDAYQNFINKNPDGALMGAPMAAPTKDEKRHMGKVQQLGCIICAGPALVHHAGTGAGGRRDHMKALPLCHYHHQGEQGIHTMGRKRWQEIYGTETELLVKVGLALSASNL